METCRPKDTGEQIPAMMEFKTFDPQGPVVDAEQGIVEAIVSVTRSTTSTI